MVTTQLVNQLMTQDEVPNMTRSAKYGMVMTQLVTQLVTQDQVPNLT